ncbi:MAG: hypothetical protein V4642_03185 [Bacteroidota bacterium]
MFQILAGLLFCVLLYGCTPTLPEHHYRITALENGRVAILALQSNGIHDTTALYLRDVFQKTVPMAFTLNDVRNVAYIDKVTTSQDSVAISNQAIELCRRNKLDAIVISNISNVKVDNEYTTPGVPVGIPLGGGFGINFTVGDETGRRIDFDLEMKLIGKDGLVLMTSNETTKPGVFLDRRRPVEIMTSTMKNAATTIAKHIMYNYWYIKEHPF